VRIDFITWMSHCRRSDGIADALGGTSHLVSNMGFQNPRTAPLRYLLDGADTLRILLRSKPDAVLVASPPFLAPALVAAYAAVRRIPFVIDAHTGVFNDPRWAWATPINRFLSRRAAATIVTSDHLRRTVEGWDARVVIVGDVPVTFPDVPAADLGEGFNVTMVSSFSFDEPFREVFEAVRGLDGVRVHVTGRVSRAAPGLVESAPPNVRFTDFISDEEYAALMRGSDAVMALTTRDHTMQRGAYEAVAMAKPLITSDFPILRDAFSKGSVHVGADAAQIRAALETVRREAPRFAAEAAELREERREVFARRLEIVKAALRNPRRR
jgi:glycosyltransferase involved in cell wall biosynthesis